MTEAETERPLSPREKAEAKENPGDSKTPRRKARSLSMPDAVAEELERKDFRVEVK